ncbi:chemotaxis protein CheX [Lacticaseibacillus rhamnosus]
MGACHARAIVRYSSSTAIDCASCAGLGGDQLTDAVGEICNINAGDFKAKIGYGAKCMLTVPTIIEGTDYRVVRPVMGKDSIQIPLQYEDEPIWVALEIRK